MYSKVIKLRTLLTGNIMEYSSLLQRKNTGKFKGMTQVFYTGEILIIYRNRLLATRHLLVTFNLASPGPFDPSGYEEVPPSMEFTCVTIDSR